MIALLDANVLIAQTDVDHVHHSAARRWLKAWDGKIATCPITEGALVRWVLRGGGTSDDAREALEVLEASDRHEFWPDALAFRQVALHGVVGHRQVIDAPLAGLARARGGRLATMDHGLAKLHDDVATPVPIEG